MADNTFTKQEIVAWENMLEGFNDAEVLARNVAIYDENQTDLERAGNTVWRTVPYIMDSNEGIDQTGNFNGKVQLSVPSTISIEENVTWTLSSTELRDASQKGELKKGAMQKLGSLINQSVLNVASLQGSLVVQVKAAATGYDDVAEIEALMNETGVPFEDRVLALSTRDYNGMAGNLAERQTVNGKVKEAYERSYIGQVASFDTWKMDTSKRLAAAAGGAITVNTAAAGNFYTPKATDTNTVNGGQSNVDNRFVPITVTATADVKAGDAFTIADVYNVHAITKESTGILKTFRVKAVVDGTTLQITPPIVDPAKGAGEQGEIQYQNVEVDGAGSATAAITWLNTASAYMNPFWQKDAIEIMPGRFVEDAGAGVGVLKGQTDAGIEVCMTKQYDIDIKKYKYRIDVFYGVTNLNPEMSGVILFDQI